MKKFLTVITASVLLILNIFSVNAAPSGSIYDFTSITDSDITSGLPTGWGNLAGTRTASLKQGDFGLLPEKKYLEITNNATTGSWGVPPVFPGIHQFKDKVLLSEGCKLHLTATVAAYSDNFYQVGLYARRADVAYVDVNGKTGTVGDADFSAYIALLSFEKKDGNIILAAWGQDITPADFTFETERFYKLDCVINGFTNTMDAYLDGEFIQTVDYSFAFSEMVASKVNYDFTDTTAYQSFHISQVKRIGIVQHKPKSVTANVTIGLYNVGYMLYGADDVIPDITFKQNDFAVGGDFVSLYSDTEKIIVPNKQTTIANLKASIQGNGTVKFYKNSAYTEQYEDSDYITYPAYVSYYSEDDFQVFNKPIVSELYIDNVTVAPTSGSIVVSGDFITYNHDGNALILIAGYKSDQMVIFETVAVDAEKIPFSTTVTTDKEYDRVDVWAIDSWSNRATLSKIYTGSL